LSVAVDTVTGMVAAASPRRTSCAATLERTWLDERSWVDVGRGWLPAVLAGESPDANCDMGAVYAAVAAWPGLRVSRMWRYERWVEEPRLMGSVPAGGQPPHAALESARLELRRHYGVPLDGVVLACYRTGGDAIGFHRDRELRYLDNTLVAILSLGARRSFLVRPRGTAAERFGPDRRRHSRPRADALELAPAAGDLIVLGGAAQAGWEHAVPVVRRPVGPRISAQWRWTSGTGPPDTSLSYRAPRRFSPG
jgi:alkylated DNA repair dioxygenase AlkB